jgi:SAM-dependent methyltransferase
MLESADQARTGAPRCPGCGQDGPRLAWQIGDRLFRTTERVFSLFRCQACTLLFLWPVPDDDELARYYPTGYWAAPRDSHGGGLRRRLSERYRRIVLRDHVQFVRRAIEEQRRLGGSVRVLDIGCGDGSVLSALDHDDVAGLDFAADAVAACRARGIDARRGGLEANPFSGERFEVVTMFHFLEHVSPADDTLAKVKDLLTPGGALIIQVPNADSWQAKLLGARWAGYDVPRHLIDYTPDTLRQALARSGFDCVHVTHRSLRDNPATLANSLFPDLYPPGRDARGQTTEGYAWVGDAAYFAVTLACLPFALLESAAGHGAAVMVQGRVRG